MSNKTVKPQEADYNEAELRGNHQNHWAQADWALVDQEACETIGSIFWWN